jgi:hypothetical protein
MCNCNKPLSPIKAHIDRKKPSLCPLSICVLTPFYLYFQMPFLALLPVRTLTLLSTAKSFCHEAIRTVTLSDPHGRTGNSFQVYHARLIIMVLSQDTKLGAAGLHVEDTVIVIGTV